jgi:hypothetical protein
MSRSEQELEITSLRTAIYESFPDEQFDEVSFPVDILRNHL